MNVTSNAPPSTGSACLRVLAILLGALAVCTSGCRAQAPQQSAHEGSGGQSSTSLPSAPGEQRRVASWQASRGRLPLASDSTDRRIVTQVIAALPPTERRYVAWLHVPPGKPGYEDLPNHGLIVIFAKHLGGAHYVLYHDNSVRLNSCAVYDENLDAYLTAVPTCFQDGGME